MQSTFRSLYQRIMWDWLPEQFVVLPPEPITGTGHIVQLIFKLLDLAKTRIKYEEGEEKAS